MIDILIPVLGRPQNAAPLVENILSVTEVPHRILFICSIGDDPQINAVIDQVSPCAVSLLTMTHPAGAGDYARKINWGFLATDNDWIFQAADDLVFQPGWDTTALNMANAGPGYDVVATNDLSNGSVRRGLFGTHNLIRRRYVTDHGGQVLHEGYDHNFVDRELCGWAQSRGVYVFARRSRVKHNHPLWRTAPQDATYRKSLARFRQDQRLFLSRAHLWSYHGLSVQERRMAA